MPDYLPVVSFDQLEPAQALARRLDDEGFGAIASSDSAEQLLKFYNIHPRAHCHVLVPGEKIQAALQWIKNLPSGDPLLSAAIVCPECGSTRIEYPQFSRKTIIGALPALAATAGIIDREFYCTDCQFTWAPEAGSDKVPSSDKHLMN